jgi:hypothetical protein
LEAAVRVGKKVTLPEGIHGGGAEETIALGGFRHEPNCTAPMQGRYITKLSTQVRQPRSRPRPNPIDFLLRMKLYSENATGYNE